MGGTQQAHLHFGPHTWKEGGPERMLGCSPVGRRPWAGLPSVGHLSLSSCLDVHRPSPPPPVWPPRGVDLELPGLWAWL